jgi:hypothetical protein
MLEYEVARKIHEKINKLATTEARACELEQDLMLSQKLLFALSPPLFRSFGSLSSKEFSSPFDGKNIQAKRMFKTNKDDANNAGAL